VRWQVSRSTEIQPPLTAREKIATRELRPFSCLPCNIPPARPLTCQHVVATSHSRVVCCAASAGRRRATGNAFERQARAENARWQVCRAYAAAHARLPPSVQPAHAGEAPAEAPQRPQHAGACASAAKAQVDATYANRAAGAYSDAPRQHGDSHEATSYEPGMVALEMSNSARPSARS